MSSEFDPRKYYEGYAKRILLRPGYPARAQAKSTVAWNVFGKELMRRLGTIQSYADVGGGFGFGANCLAFHISKAQDGTYPRTTIFELSEEYTLGQQIFPYIKFITRDVTEPASAQETLDLISLFDVIEHVPEPGRFLDSIATKVRYALAITPLETAADWRGGAPTTNLTGAAHPEGHVNFFNVKTYHRLIAAGSFAIIGKTHYMVSLKPRFAIDPSSMYPEDNIRPYAISKARHLLTKPVKYLITELLPSAIYRRLMGGCWAMNLLQSQRSG